MNLDLERITDTINATWSNYGQMIVIIGMAVSVLLAAVAIWRTINVIRHHSRKTTLDSIVSSVVTIMILVLSAEGMFVVLTTKISYTIPWYLAWAVCAVVEGLLVVFFREAEKFNQLHGRPGPYGKAFWVVAAAGGAIVAMSTSSAVEVLLRLSLPLSVALLHWIKLTAGNRRPSKVTWLITPTRILARLGILTGEEQTLTDAQIQRQTRRLVRMSYLYSSTRTDRSRTRALRRLQRLMLNVTPEVAEAAARQIELVYGMEHQIASAMASGSDKRIHGLDSSASGETPAGLAPVNGSKINGASGLPAPVSAMIQPTAIVAPRRAALPSSTSVAERDAEIVEKYREAFRELARRGLLCRSRIETVCRDGGNKVLARQANRILAIMKDELDIRDDEPITE